jgi:hypothetical protein
VCIDEIVVGDDGVERFGNAPESNYGFDWQPSKDVVEDIVRDILGRQLF